MTQSQRPPLPPLPTPPIASPTLNKAVMDDGPADATEFIPSSVQPNVASPLPDTPPRAFGRSPGQPSLAELVRHAFDEGFSDVHLTL